MKTIIIDKEGNEHVFETCQSARVIHEDVKMEVEPEEGDPEKADFHFSHTPEGIAVDLVPDPPLDPGNPCPVSRFSSISEILEAFVEDEPCL
jgi:uncharacterized protein YrzB (UPF0473 family)